MQAPIRLSRWAYLCCLLGSLIVTSAGYALAVPAGESYAPPNGDQLLQLQIRAGGIYGESSAVTNEVAAIKNAVNAGGIANASSPGSASYSYDNYVNAVTSAVGDVADAVGDVVDAVSDAAPSAPAASGSSSSGSSGFTIKGGISF